MEPKNSEDKPVIYIAIDQSMLNHNDELLSEWLSNLIAQAMYANTTESNEEPQSSSSLLEELDYLDSTVVGDNHPDVLDLILSSYNKFK